MPAGLLLVVEKADRSLGVVDLDSGRRIGGVRASGFTPHEVVATADGKRAFLPVYGDANVGQPGTDGSTVDVVDLRELDDRKVKDDKGQHVTIDLGEPARPHDVALGVEGRIYVTTENLRTVSILDPETLEVVQSVPTGHDQSHMVALSSDGRYAYTANVEPGSVSVLDLASGTLARIVEFGTRINRISIAPDDGTVYVADQESPRLGILSTADWSIRWVALPAVGFGTAPTPDGTRLLVGFRPTSQVGILDLATGELTHLLDVPPTPQRIVIPPPRTSEEDRGRTSSDERPEDFAYVTCDESDLVVEIDLLAGEVRREIGVGGSPDGLAWSRVAPERASA
jgi:DNA-binding beta-propeller fold protein YncE